MYQPYGKEELRAPASRRDVADFEDMRRGNSNNYHQQAGPPSVDFDDDVQREMRALEMNIRKMLSDDPVLASMAEKSASKPLPQVYPAKQEYPPVSQGYPPKQGYPSFENYPPSQGYPPRQDNSSKYHLSQPTYAQQLQQQIREKNVGAISVEERQARRLQSEQNRENANFMDSFSNNRKGFPQKRYDPSEGLLVPHSGLDNVVDRRPLPRRNVEANVPSDTGLMLGHSKSEELALKRAKQQQYKQELDALSTRYPSTNRVRPTATEPPMQQQIPPKAGWDVRDQGYGAPVPPARVNNNNYYNPRDNDPRYPEKPLQYPPNNEYTERGNSVANNPYNQPYSQKPPPAEYTPSFQQNAPIASKARQQMNNAAGGIGLNIGMGESEANQRRKREQEEYRLYLDRQVKEREAAKNAEKKMARQDDERVLNEARHNADNIRHKKPQPSAPNPQQVPLNNNYPPVNKSYLPPTQYETPPTDVDLSDEAVFEEMVRREMMKEREMLKEKLLHDESLFGNSALPPSGSNNYPSTYASSQYQHPDDEPQYSRPSQVPYPANRQDLFAPRDRDDRSQQQSYANNSPHVNPSQQKRPEQPPVAQPPTGGRYNPLLGDDNAKWVPSGNQVTDKQKVTMLQQRAALDLQIQQDKERKRREKEEEEERERKREEKIRQMEEEQERDAREKKLKQQQEAKMELDAAQRRSEAEAAKRRNLHKKEETSSNNNQHHVEEPRKPPPSKADLFGPYDDPRRQQRDQTNHHHAHHANPAPQKTTNDEYNPPKNDVDLSDEAAFEEMVRREMMKEREMLKAQLLEDDSRRGGGYATYEEPARPRQQQPDMALVTPRDRSGPTGGNVNYNHPSYASNQHIGDSPQVTSPGKSPTAARIRLQQDVYGRYNPLVGELPDDTAASGGNRWMPSGKQVTDKQKATMLQQRAALDLQIQQDKDRKKREKEEEEEKERKREEKARKLEEDKEREDRDKKLKHQQEARQDFEAAQRRSEAEAAKRRNLHNKDRAGPSSDHTYSDIASPLKDAVHKYDARQEDAHRQGHGYGRDHHSMPPPTLTDSVDQQLHHDRDTRHNPNSSHYYSQESRDPYRNNYNQGDDGYPPRRNGGGYYDNQSPRESYNSSFPKQNNHHKGGYNYAPGGYDARDSYDRYSSGYNVDEDNDRGYDLSLVAESRLVEPDTSGMLADILPRRSYQKASSNASDARHNVRGSGGRGGGGALDLEQSLTSASTFLYVGEQTPLEMPSSRPRSTAGGITNPIQRPPTSGTTLNRDNMPPAGRPTSSSSSVPSVTPRLNNNNSSVMSNLMRQDEGTKPVTPAVSHKSLPQQQQQQPEAVIPTTRVLQQSVLPSAQDIPDNRRFLKNTGSSAHNMDVDPTVQRGGLVSSHNNPSNPYPLSTTLPSADAASSVPRSLSSPAVDADPSRPSSSSGVQYRSKFAQELLANQATVTPYDTTRPSSSSNPHQPQQKKPAGWDLANREQTVRQLNEHSSSVAALLSGTYAPKEVERPKYENNVYEDAALDADLGYSDEEFLVTH